MERDFDLSYSLRMVSEENVKRQLEEIKQKVVLDDNTDTLPPCPKCHKTTYYKVD